MAIRRVVPNIVSDDVDLSRGFYEGFLGLEQAMDMGCVRRFFVRDPNGVIINVLTHLPRSGG